MVKNKGFTLIELLVVIAIISLLASIVMTSLNGAKAKAKDSARLQYLAEFRRSNEIFFNDYGCYLGENPNNCSRSWDDGSGRDASIQLADLQKKYFPFIDSGAAQFFTEIRGSYWLPTESPCLDSGNVLIPHCYVLEFYMESQTGKCYYNDTRGVGVSDICYPEPITPQP